MKLLAVLIFLSTLSYADVIGIPSGGGSGSSIATPVSIANGGTNKALTLSAGGVPYFDGDSFEVLAAGSSGKVLTSGGAGAPTWETSSASQWTSDAGGIYYVPTGTAAVSVGVASGTDHVNEVLRVQAKASDAWVATFMGPGANDSAFGMITLASGTDSQAAWFQSFHNAAVTDNPLRINPQGGDVSIASGGGQAKLGSAVNKVSMIGYTSCTALTTNGSDVVGCTASDENLKKNIVPFERGLEALKDIKPITFQFKDAGDMGIEHSGFSAQNVEKSISEAVRIGSDGMRMLDYWTIIAVQTNAINELRARLEALEAANPPVVKAVVKVKKSIPQKPIWKAPKPKCRPDNKYCGHTALKLWKDKK